MRHPSRRVRRLAFSLLFLLPLHLASAQNAPTSTTYGTFGLDMTAIDSTLRPGDDFWAYANGAWAKSARFAGNQEVVGVAADFNALADARAASLMDRPEFMDSADPDQRKVAQFYASWMDATARERSGLSPLRPMLARIARLKTRADLSAAFGTAEFASPFDIDVAPTAADPNRNEVVVSAGSLGMARSYYLQQGAAFDADRAAYRRYVEQILTLSGVTAPATKAEAIVALEMRMAKAQAQGTSGGDMVVPVPVLPTQLPQVAWLDLLKARDLGGAKELRLQSGASVRALAELVASVPLGTWKDYLAFRLVSDHADYLPAAFATAREDFYDRTLYGLTASRDRASQGVRLVEKAMPEAVSRLYVKRYLDTATSQAIREMFDNVKASYAELIDRAAWMDEPTRQAARAKLAALTACIGGPNLNTDFSDLAIAKDDLFGNVVRSERKRVALLAASLASPPDACARYGFAQGGNDFYVREENRVLIPSGSMIPPFFDPAADPAVNYGAIGVTIGHEIGHGFDVDGAAFDGHGRRVNWWSDASRKAFAGMAARVSADYATMEVLPGLHVNGEKTLGEDMADLTGTQAAFMAYRKYQQRHGKAAVLNGTTGEQRFFLALAQMRRTNVREETLRFLVASDTHTPPRQRVNGVVRHIDAWYDAFSVRPGDALYVAPADRINLW